MALLKCSLRLCFTVEKLLHSYEWTLQCPSAMAQTFGGAQPYITAGSSSSNIDIGIRYTPFDCNLTLVVTDRSLRTSGINTRITIT